MTCVYTIFRNLLKQCLPAVVAGVLLMAGTTVAATRIGVINIHTRQGVEDYLGPLVTELFCAQLQDLGNYTVVTGEYIKKKLDESGNQELINCNSNSCYYLIGAGMEVEQL